MHSYKCIYVGALVTTIKKQFPGLYIVNIALKKTEQSSASVAFTITHYY